MLIYGYRFLFALAILLNYEDTVTISICIAIDLRFIPI